MVRYSERELSILKSSVPLLRIDDKNNPTSSASGCLVDYCEHRVLLTVEHATGDSGRWAIQLHFEKGKGTQLYGLGAMMFLESVSTKTGESKTVDFSYVEVPKDTQPFRQEINEKGDVDQEYPIMVFPIDFRLEPKKEDKFGFAGLVKNQLENHPTATFLTSELKIYDDLNYLRTDGDTHVFQLPFNHPGHPEFRGCSGAPVLNSSGMPIALLTGGCIKKNEIYGVSLKQYRTPIDILVGNI